MDTRPYRAGHRQGEGRCAVSTNEKIAYLGFTSEPAGHGRKAIFKDGAKVFEGRAHEVDAWLETETPCNSPGYAGPAPDDMDYSDWLAMNNID